MNSINAILDMLEVICSKIRSVYELETIINSLRSKIESSRKLKGGNAITLTTMHSAKGLEFDKVYIMDFMDEVIPSSIDSVNKAEISAHTEEERRLAYVAITRAKRDAYILYPKTLNGRKNDPSIFYKELSSIINEDKIKKQNAIEIQKSADMQIMLREGVHVKHKTFGKGSIIKKDPDRISVMFDKTSKVHCLSIETLLKNNIIEILDC
jgi:DNA helicase-2/ATP-dependent DNA helicase PcrA